MTNKKTSKQLSHYQVSIKKAWQIKNKPKFFVV